MKLGISEKALIAAVVTGIPEVTILAIFNINIDVIPSLILAAAEYGAWLLFFRWRENKK